MEKLAIARWAYRKFAGLVSTKDPDSLRGQAYDRGYADGVYACEHGQARGGDLDG